MLPQNKSSATSTLEAVSERFPLATLLPEGFSANSDDDGIAELEALVAQTRTFSSDDDDIQRWIDWLDESIASIRTQTAVYARAVRRLQLLCRKSGRLPSSCFLASEVVLDAEEPYSKSAFSDIYRGRLGDDPVALKALRVHVDSKKKVEKAFYSEVVLWRSLRHPNVVPFLGVSATMSVCLISAWMPNGSITHFLLTHPEAPRIKLLTNIINGLEYIHSLGMVHGDLKAANILINNDYEACLADFGLATTLHSTSTMTGTSSLRGTLRWMSPELLECDDAEGGTPTIASDVYAVAMVFYEVFSGLYPFNELRNDAAVMRRILKGSRPERPTEAQAFGLTDPIWNVMQECWVPDPKDRASLTDVALSLSQVEVDGLAAQTSLKTGMTVISVADSHGAANTYRLEEMLSDSTTGSVYRARHPRTNTIVAIKQISYEILEDSRHAILTSFVKDLSATPSHPNIVQIEGVTSDESHISIVLEYCDGGSLFEALQVSGRLNEKIARRCMSGIIDGLAFLHNLGIIHGDLRAANILTAQNGEVKLINYGLFIQDHIKPDLKPGLGIPLWTAPEVLETNLVTPFSDVWSLGCTLVELLTGEGPYRSVSSVESLVKHILQGNEPLLPASCSSKAKDFVATCCNVDQLVRPKAAQLREHEWLGMRNSKVRFDEKEAHTPTEADPWKALLSGCMVQ